MRAIITLQLGSYANYVGAHFWNFQDEALGYTSHEEWGAAATTVDHDILHTWTEDRHGKLAHHPRAAVLDLSGSFGGVSFSRDAPGLAANAAAASSSGAVATWAGGCHVASAPTVAKSAFLACLDAQAALPPEQADEAVAEAQQAALEEAARQLDSAEGVRYWTDYLKAELQPGSVAALPGVWHGTHAFDGFGAGAGVPDASEAVEQLGEVVRRMGEECDSLQGFQVLCDDTSGFGSLSLRVLQELADDYTSRPLLYWAVQPPRGGGGGGRGDEDAATRARAALSPALSWAEVSELAALYVRLSAPLPPPSAAGGALRGGLSALRWHPRSAFQTSALLAAGIDSATLPLRLAPGAAGPLGPATGATSMHALAQLLAAQGANCAALALQMPAGALPRGLAAAAERRDARTPSGGSASAATGAAAAAAGDAAARGAAPAYELSTEGVVSLWPGLVALPGGSCLAESVCLRGARCGGAPATTTAAAAALDAALLAERRRCVQHRCVVPLPLPVPLPFPAALFSSAVSHSGDVWRRPHASSGGGASAPAPSPGAAEPTPALAGAGRQGTALPPGGVATCPVLTRLVASSAFEGRLTAEARELSQAAGSVAGRALLAEWGYAAGDVGELEERLVQLAGRYRHADQDAW